MLGKQKVSAFKLMDIPDLDGQ